MCEFGAILGAVASIGGSLISAMGQQRQQTAQRNSQIAQVQAQQYDILAQQRQAQFNQQMADRNAEFIERQAEDELDRGRQEEARLRAQMDQVKGRQTAALAANGITLSEGTSALDSLEDTAAVTEADALTIRDDASRRAWNLRVEADSARAQGGLYGAQASNFGTSSQMIGRTIPSSSGSGLSMVGGLLTATAGVADRWSRMSG